MSKEKEFNLSEKESKIYQDYFHKDRIKEAVRRLKEETMADAPLSVISLHDIIDKTFGDKLTKEDN